MELEISRSDTAPIVIGGLGGSGTRLVTSLIEGMGVSFDGHLNGSYDNMWFSLLFVRRSILLKTEKEIDKLVWLYTNAMRHGRPIPRTLMELVREACQFGREPVLPKNDLEEAAESLMAVEPREHISTRWGWKQPNTHVMVSTLNRYYPRMKYIYVARNGLDMAFSENQNQFRYLWGDLLLEGDVTPVPENSLRYWVASYRRILDEASRLGDRIHIVNYDLLCRDPLSQLLKLKRFLGLDVDVEVFNKLVKSVSLPSGVGRYKRHDCSKFMDTDIEFVRKMGFDVDL